MSFIYGRTVSQEKGMNREMAGASVLINSWLTVLKLTDKLCSHKFTRSTKLCLQGQLMFAKQFNKIMLVVINYCEVGRNDNYYRYNIQTCNRI